MQSLVKASTLENDISNQNIALFDFLCSVFNIECISFVKLLICKLFYVTTNCLASYNIYYDSHRVSLMFIIREHQSKQKID